MTHSHADQLRVLETSIASLERHEYRGTLKPHLREFLRQGRKLRFRLKAKLAAP